MITMTNKQLGSNEFMQAAMKLTGSTFNAKTAYNIKKIMDKLHIERKRIAREYETRVAKEFCKRDEQGEVVLSDPENPQSYIIDTEKYKEPYEAAHKAFEAESFTIDREPLKLDDMGDVLFSAQELFALESIFGEIPAVELED